MFQDVGRRELNFDFLSHREDLTAAPAGLRAPARPLYWFLLSKDQRNSMMSEHAKSGMAYAGYGRPMRAANAEREFA